MPNSWRCIVSWELGTTAPLSEIALLRPVCPQWFCVGVRQWEALCTVWKYNGRSRPDSGSCRQRFGQAPSIICVSVGSSWVSRTVLLKNYFSWCRRLKSPVLTTWWAMKFTVVSRKALESCLMHLRFWTFTTPSPRVAMWASIISEHVNPSFLKHRKWFPFSWPNSDW